MISRHVALVKKHTPNRMILALEITRREKSVLYDTTWTVNYETLNTLSTLLLIRHYLLTCIILTNLNDVNYIFDLFNLKIIFVLKLFHFLFYMQISRDLYTAQIFEKLQISKH